VIVRKPDISAREAEMDALHERVREAQRFQFLRRAHETAGGRLRRHVHLGALGADLGLPYEVSLEIAAELAERRLLRVAEELEPPHGPAAWVTREGLEFLQERRAA
jgi:hypothetical protein